MGLIWKYEQFPLDLGYMKMGNKYRMEVRIRGKMFREGENTPMMLSEGISPVVVLEGNDVEDILYKLSCINELMLISDDKDNREPLPVCMSGFKDGFSVCRN